jgi:hypothetical protein
MNIIGRKLDLSWKNVNLFAWCTYLNTDHSEPLIRNSQTYGTRLFNFNLDKLTETVDKVLMITDNESKYA